MDHSIAPILSLQNRVWQMGGIALGGREKGLEATWGVGWRSSYPRLQRALKKPSERLDSEGGRG